MQKTSTFLVTDVVNSDSVTVFKSRLNAFLFARRFLSSLFSVAHYLALASLKLRPYKYVYYYYYYYLTFCSTTQHHRMCFKLR